MIMKDNTNVEDSLLRGFSFQELIDAVNSNEENVNALTVKKVFDEIVAEQLEEARYALEEHISEIIAMAQHD